MKWVQHAPRMEVAEILHAFQFPDCLSVKAAEAQNFLVLTVKVMPCVTGAAW